MTHLFSFEERSQRLANVRARMAKQDIELLAITSPENIFYLCGYSAMSYYSPQALLVSADVRDPILVIRGIDVPCAAHTSWLSMSNVIGYSDEYVDQVDRHQWSFIVNVIREHGFAHNRIGLELDGYWLSPKSVQILQDELPNSRIIDTTLLVNWVRAIKSPAELQLMREAGAVADHAMARAFEAMRPGVRECDAVGQIVAAQIGGTVRYGGHAPSEPVFIAPGTRSDSPHLYWEEKPFEAGTSVNIELGGVRQHYNAGLSRTLSLGPPSDTLKKLMDANLEAMDAALNAVKPGIAAEDVEAAYRKTLVRYGFDKPSRVGYTIGIGVNPTWIERTISLKPGDRSILQEGMTFHLMAGLWQSDVSCTASETLIVTGSGAETLSTLPRGLHCLD
jgi:Xaa-Pro aminopeptidase